MRGFTADVAAQTRTHLELHRSPTIQRPNLRRYPIHCGSPQLCTPQRQQKNICRTWQYTVKHPWWQSGQHHMQPSHIEAYNAVHSSALSA